MKRRHVEYLPYPDGNFQEEVIDEGSIENNSYEEISFRYNKTFVSGLPVEITKIEAKKISNPVKEFLYPYL